MDEIHQEIISEVISKTSNDLILFFIILIIALIIFVIPLYGMIIKDRSGRVKQDGIRQDKYIEREKQVLQVVTANTEVMAGLKETLILFSNSTGASFTRVHERIDAQYGNCAEHGVILSRIVSTLEHIVREQHKISEDVKQTLLIIDNILNINNFPTRQDGAAT